MKGAFFIERGSNDEKIININIASDYAYRVCE